MKRCRILFSSGVLDNFHSPSCLSLRRQSRPILNGTELLFLFPEKPRLCRFFVREHVLISMRCLAAHSLSYAEDQRESASCVFSEKLLVLPPSEAGVLRPSHAARTGGGKHHSQSFVISRLSTALMQLGTRSFLFEFLAHGLVSECMCLCVHTCISCELTVVLKQ